MADRPTFLVLTPGQVGAAFADYDAAETAAAQGVAKDRSTRLIVKVVGEVRERREPNVTVVRLEEEAGHE